MKKNNICTMLELLPNGHSQYVAHEDTRFPLSSSLDETTSHSTKLQNAAAKSLVIPQAGESDKVSLRELFIKFGARYVALFLLGILSACSGDQDVDMLAQKWQGVDVRVEVRPSPPRAGMSEFLVMATGERGRPVYDLIVSLRTDDQDAWKQAIQDGQVGVYRRAVEVGPGTRSVLQVQIKRNSEEGVLRFPLNLTRNNP